MADTRDPQAALRLALEQRRLSRRAFVIRAVGLGLALPLAGGLLAACSGGAAPAATSGAATGATAGAAAGATVAAVAPTAAAAAGAAASAVAGAAPTVAAAAGAAATAGAAAAPTAAAAATKAPAAATPAAAAATPAAAGAATPAAGATAAPASGAGKKYKVSILNKEMSKDEIVAALQKEGEVNVANWTYTANDAIVGRFQAVVKEEWGVDVKCNYLPSQSPSIYLTNLYTAAKGGNPAPYDMMNIEEAYYYEAKGNNVVQDDTYPSDLIPNWVPVDKRFKRTGQAVAFQATAFPVVVHTTDWFKEWKDIADPRLKGKLTIPEVGDITNGGHLVGLAWSLGKDYKKPDDMKAVVDFMLNQVKPNVLKVTTDSAEMQRLLRSGAATACCFWNSLARLEQLSGQPGTDKTVYTLPSTGAPVINGYAWIPKNAPHPLLAQLFVNWRISSDGLIPTDKWPTKWQENKGAWSEIFEGVLYADQEKDVPSWFADDYKKFYPQYKDYDSLKAVDWDYYAAHNKEWQDAEQKGLA